MTDNYVHLCPSLLSHLRFWAIAVKDFESTYNCIQNHIVNLPMSEYSDLMNKVKVEECTTYEEANEVLMTKLRIICELRQLDHVHGRETEVMVWVGERLRYWCGWERN